MTKREYLSKRGIISMLPSWVAEEEADEAFKASVDNLAEHYDTIWTEDEGVTYAPVRHGKWEGIGQTAVTCSRCGAWSETATRYCGNCGAKMEKEEDI